MSDMRWESGFKSRARLGGRVAIITGGGRGIGAATAVELAEAGASVVVSARTAEAIQAVAEGIRRGGGKAEAVPTNVADAGQVAALMQRTMDCFGRVDFLIHCAAVLGPIGQRTWEATPRAWREGVAVDLIGLFLVCHAVLPHMLCQGSGRVLSVSSAAGERILPRASAYCAARAGANQFMRILSGELRGTGITANIVYPGIVDTPALQEFRSSFLGDAQGQALIRPRRITPRDASDAAQLLLWLCSPTTKWMNGQVISLDDPSVQRRVATFLNPSAPEEPESHANWASEGAPGERAGMEGWSW